MHVQNLLERPASNSIQKLLGIYINAKLSFDDHVQIICLKASQKLNVLSEVGIIST